MNSIIPADLLEINKSLDQLSVARLEVGLFKAMDERLDLGRISFRNAIALGHRR